MAKKATPKYRKIDVRIPHDHITSWHSNNPNISNFYNALSTLFPQGERFFIDSVKYYRDQVQDPDLKRDIANFIRQEAEHTRIHRSYTAALEANNIPARWVDRKLKLLLDTVKQRLPRRTQLAATVALEHYTAVMADVILKNPSLFDHNNIKSDQLLQDIWTWHALEETEHKSVAFRVFQQTSKNKTTDLFNLRTSMIVSSILFWPILTAVYLNFNHNTPQALQRGHIHNTIELMRYLWGQDRLLPRMLTEVVEFMRSDFNPDNLNNYYLINEYGVDRLVERINQGS